MSVKKFLAACAFFVCAAVPAQALIVSASSNLDGNCYPFGCPSTDWGPEYQQVYNSGLFPGPMTIGSLRFYHSYHVDIGTLNSGTYVISLSTTSKAVNGLDNSNLANNLGPDDTTVFTGLLPPSVPFGSFFDIFFDVGFPYDPSDGNLLIDVFSNTGSGGYAFLDAGIFDDNSSGRAYSADSGGRDTRSYGLLTGFNEGHANAVPEPATLPLVGLSLLGAAVARRRRRS
jgi:hypothetical protein